jgi:allophanate hydrolase subunit 2
MMEVVPSNNKPGAFDVLQNNAPVATFYDKQLAEDYAAGGTVQSTDQAYITQLEQENINLKAELARIRTILG